jgi:hypothetical protein
MFGVDAGIGDPVVHDALQVAAGMEQERQVMLVGYLRQLFLHRENVLSKLARREDDGGFVTQVPYAHQFGDILELPARAGIDHLHSIRDIFQNLPNA